MICKNIKKIMEKIENSSFDISFSKIYRYFTDMENLGLNKNPYL